MIPVQALLFTWVASWLPASVKGACQPIPTPRAMSECYWSLNNYTGEVIGEDASYFCREQYLTKTPEVHKKIICKESSKEFVQSLVEPIHGYRNKRQSGNSACIRKELRQLSSEEYNTLIHCLQVIRDDGSYYQLADLHDSNAFGGAHSGRAFLSWHSEYMRRLELLLQTCDSSICAPYWDTRFDAYLTDPSTSAIFELIGGPSGSLTGSLAGWRDRQGNLVQRAVGSGGSGALLIDYDEYDVYLTAETTSDMVIGSTNDGTKVIEWGHNRLHVYCGGTVLNGLNAAYDPLFFLLHGGVDMIFHRCLDNMESPNEYPEGSSGQTAGANMVNFEDVTNYNSYTDNFRDLFSYMDSPSCSNDCETHRNLFYCCRNHPTRGPHCVSKIFENGEYRVDNDYCPSPTTPPPPTPTTPPPTTPPPTTPPPTTPPPTTPPPTTPPPTTPPPTTPPPTTPPPTTPPPTTPPPTTPPPTTPPPTTPPPTTPPPTTPPPTTPPPTTPHPTTPPPTTPPPTTPPPTTPPPTTPPPTTPPPTTPPPTTPPPTTPPPTTPPPTTPPPTTPPPTTPPPTTPPPTTPPPTTPPPTPPPPTFPPPTTPHPPRPCKGYKRYIRKYINRIKRQTYFNHNHPKPINDFAIDGVHNLDAWSYISVSVTSDNDDVVLSGKNNQFNTYYYMMVGEAKGYKRCHPYELPYIHVETVGINYLGFYTDYTYIDNRSSSVFVAIKTPCFNSPTKVMLTAFDGCGRLCRPFCPDLASLTPRYIPCDGAIEVDNNHPYVHGKTVDDVKQLYSDGKQLPYAMHFVCDGSVVLSP